MMTGLHRSFESGWMTWHTQCVGSHRTPKGSDLVAPHQSLVLENPVRAHDDPVVVLRIGNCAEPQVREFCLTPNIGVRIVESADHPFGDMIRRSSSGASFAIQASSLTSTFSSCQKLGNLSMNPAAAADAFHGVHRQCRVVR